MLSSGSSAISREPIAFHSLLFEQLVANPLCSDVTLVTDDGERIPAHKAILCAVSPTFMAMFSNAHHLESKSLEVTVPYNCSTFRVALRYMYTGVVDPFNDPLELLDASSYFCLDSLKECAVNMLKQQTTSDNTFAMLHIALQFNCSSLRDHCITLIRQYNTEVIHSKEWLGLPLDVALLLVQETVIEGEMCILRRCVEWCRHNYGKDNDGADSVSSSSAERSCTTPPDLTVLSVRKSVDVREGGSIPIEKGALLKFIQFVDFTKMTESEVDEVEEMGCIPLDVLYRAFKSHSLKTPPPHLPRKGGIILQWEFSNASDISFNDNHVNKVSSDYQPRTVYAINRFSKGRHYFTFAIEDFRSPHDCLIGVSNKAAQRDYHFEPCCMTLCTPSGTEVVAAISPGTPLLSDHRCVIGVLVDFHTNCLQWYNHTTKQLLFTAKPQQPEDGSAPVLLEQPLVPSVTLYHKSNGGVVLAECTSFLGDRAVPPPLLTHTPKSNKTPSPLKATVPLTARRRL